MSQTFFLMYNISLCYWTLIIHFCCNSSPQRTILPSEISEIECNPFEEWLICLTFCSAQSPFPSRRIRHVTSESLTHHMSLHCTDEAKFKRSHDLPIIHSTYFPNHYLEYNMLSFCHFSIMLLTLQPTTLHWVSRKLIFLLTHIQAFIEMFASLVFGVAGSVDSSFHAWEFFCSSLEWPVLFLCSLICVSHHADL